MSVPGVEREPAATGEVIHMVTQEEVDGWQEVGAWPDRALRSAIRTVGWGSGGLTGREFSWTEWCDLEPLGMDFSVNLEAPRWQRALRQDIRKLRDLCSHPATHLRHETERMPVHRAKRVAVRALEHLASHTEDWERRTTHGVQPQRILARRNDLTIDIYENRFVKQLLEALGRRLTSRIRDVTRMHSTISELKHLQLESTDNFRRANRVFSLYCRSEAAIELDKAAEESLKELRALRRVVVGLRESPLGRNASLLRHRNATLKKTNLLSSDPRYRAAGALWEVLKGGDRGKPPTPEARLEGYRRDLVSFDRFCLLLTVRALDQMGWNPQEGESGSPWSADGLKFDSPVGGMVFRVLPDGTHEIQAENGGFPILRFLPVMSTLRSQESRELQDRVLKLLARQTEEGEGHLVALYVDSWTDEGLPHRHLSELLPLWGLGAERGRLRASADARLGMIPVSPLVLSSVERIARSILWTFLPPILRRYPIRLDLPVEVARNLGELPSWLQASLDGEFVSLERPVSESDTEGLSKQVERALRSLDGKMPGRERERRMLEDWHARLKERLREMGSLLICPVCDRSSRNGHWKNRGEFFQCACSSRECRSVLWGSEPCAECVAPVIFLQHRERDDMLCDVLPGEIDREFGRDVLSAPVLGEDGRMHRFCSRCLGDHLAGLVSHQATPESGCAAD